MYLVVIMIEKVMLVGRCVLTVNSINIAPEINAFIVSVRVCNRCHVQLQAEQIKISVTHKLLFYLGQKIKKKKQKKKALKLAC
jgi:hypothetical protein